MLSFEIIAIISCVNIQDHTGPLNPDVSKPSNTEQNDPPLNIIKN